jgi:hypothetical protein
LLGWLVIATTSSLFYFRWGLAFLLGLAWNYDPFNLSLPYRWEDMALHLAIGWNRVSKTLFFFPWVGLKLCSSGSQPAKELGL